MRRNSLAFRLFGAATVWILLILPATAVALISLYREAVESSFDVRLNYYLQYLIAASTPHPDKGIVLEAPGTLGEPLFALPASGWYWQIKPSGKDAEPIYKSESLVSEVIDVPDAPAEQNEEGEPLRAYIHGPEGQLLRVVQREIVFPEPPQPRTFSFAVAGDAHEIDEAVASFTAMLVVAFGVLGGGLLLAIFFQVRFGLRPLRVIGERLAAIRSGDAEKLEGAFPEEIRPLQQELNQLIRSNQEIIERSRTHVGNLAHALKTPLSVITNEARSRHDDFGKKVAEQAEIMRQQVTHYLDRARMAAHSGVVGRATQLRPVIRGMCNTLSKIYGHRDVEISLECPEEVRFLGEKQDLQEMVGNLMENACKWAGSKVKVTVERSGEPDCKTQPTLVVLVDDDGPGLPADLRSTVVKRGRRIDNNKPGSGLGLSIVADLSDMYKGHLSLGESPLGGLRARLELPAAPSSFARPKNARI